MNEIRAHYTDRASDRGDGLSNQECPLCGKVALELDMEEYYEEGTDRVIECCTDCREDFEQDSDLKLDSDTPSKDVFAKLMAYAEHLIKNRKLAIASGLTGENAHSIADALGGEAGEGGHDLGLVGDVEAGLVHNVASPAQGGRSTGQPSRIGSVQHHGRARPGQSFGHGVPQPTRRSGDQRGAAGQVEQRIAHAHASETRTVRSERSNTAGSNSVPRPGPSIGSA